MDRPGSGLRRLTGLLLLVNAGVLLAGWAGNYWQGPSSVVTFNAEKIRMLDDVVPERRAESQDEASTAATSDAQPQANCRAWPVLDADGVAQVQAHMRRSGVADEAYDLQVAMRLGWWVFIPPLENPDALQVVMDDARAKGVNDMVPVRSGSLANALALGTFPNMEGARKHAQAMLDKGLRNVRFAPRPGAGNVQLGIVADSPALQGALKAAWPPGLEPVACTRQ